MSFIQTMTGGSVRYLSPVRRAKANGLLARTYSGIERDFALVPPLTIHSQSPEILAGLWCAFREVFIVDSAQRDDKEVISAAISQVNTCPYCVEVHTAMLDGAGDHRLAAAIRNGEPSADANPLIAWAKATLKPGAAELLDPPFAPSLAPQMLGTAVLFHYINRMVSVFLADSPTPVRIKSRIGRSLFGRAFGGIMGRRLLAVEAQPGLSHELADRAPLPEAFEWARSAPIIAAALARFNHAVEAIAAAHVSIEVHEAVTARLASWRGETMPITNQWIDDAMANIENDSERAAAKLALLTAFAPYRVEAKTIEDFQNQFPGEEALVAITSWASLAAAKRISSWIAPAVTPAVLKAVR